MTGVVDPAQVMADLNAAAAAADQLSKDLADVERRIGPLRQWHDALLDEAAVRLWADYRAGELRAFPSEAVRRALAEHELEEAHRGMLEKLNLLEASRRRLIRRIDDVRAVTSARQSILAALRVELEITARTGG